MTDSFKEISIRGRLAFGAICLERTLSHVHFQDDLLNNIVLPRIWNFTNSKNLNTWDESVNEIDPICLLDSMSGSNTEKKTITNKNYNELKELYRSLPSFITEMISDVIQIGVANLYGGTGAYSSLTLKPLSSVVIVCNNLGIALPDLEIFKQTPYSEDHGWGKDRKREDFLKV